MEELSAWNRAELVPADSYGEVLLWQDAKVRAANDGTIASDELVTFGRSMLTLAEEMISDAFWNVAQVDAVYADVDAEGLLMVFVVVAQHDDEVYDRILQVEEKLVGACGQPLELRIRAHQGRNPRKAVPIGTLPLFLR